MSAARKNLPPPDDDGLGVALRRRLTRDEEPATSGDTSRTDRTSRTGARSASPARPPATVRRSWYMPASSAEALARAIDDLHYATRRPKHEVIAALVAVALEHAEDARARLADRDD